MIPNRTNKKPRVSPSTEICHNSSKTIRIDQTGLNTNPKGGNRLWRMHWAWFREIDVLNNEELNFGGTTHHSLLTTHSPSLIISHHQLSKPGGLGNGLKTRLLGYRPHRCAALREQTTNLGTRAFQKNVWKIGGPESPWEHFRPNGYRLGSEGSN